MEVHHLKSFFVHVGLHSVVCVVCLVCAVRFALGVCVPRACSRAGAPVVWKALHHNLHVRSERGVNDLSRMSMKAIATGGVHSRDSAGIPGPLSPQELHVIRTVRRELQKRSQAHKSNTSAVLPLLSMPDQPTMASIYPSVRAFEAPYVLVLRHPQLGPGEEVSRATIHQFLDENAVFANVSMLFVMKREGEPSSNFTALEALDQISSWMLTAVLSLTSILSFAIFFILCFVILFIFI